LLQAFTYVDAEVIDKRVPPYPIKFAMVYQSRSRWQYRLERSEFGDEQIIDSIQMDAIELVFNSFRVGYIYITIKEPFSSNWVADFGLLIMDGVRNCGVVYRTRFYSQIRVRRQA